MLFKAEGIFVRLLMVRNMKLNLLGTDPVSDIAVIKIQSDKKLLKL